MSRTILLVVILLLLRAGLSVAQVSVHDGTGTAPDVSSMLDVQSANKGALLPRMSSANRAAIAPTVGSDFGLVVFDTTTNSYWYWDGAAWRELPNTTSLPDASDFIVNSSALQTSANFNIDGNGALADLTITGGDITSAGILRVGSTTDIRMRLDTDANGSNEFQITNNGGTSAVFAVTEAGNVTTSGFGDFGGYGQFNGNLTLLGNDRNLVAANNFNVTGTSGIDVIIDSDNNSTNAEYRVQRDLGTDLFVLQEDGDIFFSDLVAAGTGLLQADPAGQVTRTTLDPTTVVTGSGTVNYLARWTPSGSVLGIGATRDDGSNVGIGTAPTSARLTLGPATGANVLLINDINTAEWQIKTGGYDLSFANDYDDNSTYDTRLFLQQDGYVGIGNTAPAQKLEVTGGRIRITEATGGILELTNSTLPKTNYVFTDASGHLNVRTDAAASHVLLQTTGTQGNVGIGAASPNQKLEVAGNTRITGLGGSGDRLIQTNNAGDLSIAPSSINTSAMVDGAGAATRVTYWSDANTLTSSADFLYANESLSVFNPETSTAEVRLGAAWGRPGVYSSQQLELQSGTTGVLFGNGNVEYMRLASTGNLGIGANNPLEALEIFRNGSNPVQLFHSSGVASYKMGNDGNVFKIAAMDNGFGGSVGNFAANDGQVIAITTVGNVGIGNVNGSHKLHVGEATADGQGITIRGYSNTPTSWKGGAAFGFSGASVIMGQLNGVAQIGGHNGTLTAWADLALNSAAGNVGVGIAAPQSKLHVMGKVNIHQSGAGGGQNRFEGMHVPTDANGRGQLVISSAYSDLIVASSQGNDNHGSTISIATYDPANAASYRKWVINQGNWGARSQFLDFGYGVNIPNPHSAINAGNTTLTLDGVNRRVGIGEISPSSKLEILHNTTMANDMYNLSNIEVVTNNASNPSIGFHRGGYSATALYHAGYGNNSLRIRNADGLDAALLHEGNFSTYGIQNQYTGAQAANAWVNGTFRADAAMRAPFFTAADYNGGIPGGDGTFYRTAGQAEISFDDWLYFRDANTNTIRHQFNSDLGEILLGPNTGWSRYLRIGGNPGQTGEANIGASDGNLHIDNRAGHALYLNHYVNNWVRHGNGGTGYILNGSFEYFDNDDWMYNRYAPNDRVYFENRVGVKGNIALAGNPWGWADARCTACGDAVNGNPNLWLTAQDRIYLTARNTGEAYEFGMETPGSGTYDKAVVPQFSNWGRLGTPSRHWYITYSGYFRYKHFWDDYEGFDTYDDIAELRAIQMDTVWDPILNHHVGKVRGSTIPKFLTNYEDKEGAGEFIDVRRMDGFLLGVSRQIDRETVERDERLAARTEVLASALGVDFSKADDRKVKVRIQDMGSGKGNTDKILVRYAEDFSRKAETTPIVSITPTAPHSSYYVCDKTPSGFTVHVTRAAIDVPFSFDWTATAETHASTTVNGKVIERTDDVFYRKPIQVTGKDHPISDHSKKRDLSAEERSAKETERQRIRAEQISREHIEQMNRDANVPPHSKVAELPPGVTHKEIPADPKGRSAPPDSKVGEAVTPKEQAPIPK